MTVVVTVAQPPLVSTAIVLPVDWCYFTKNVHCCGPVTMPALVLALSLKPLFFLQQYIWPNQPKNKKATALCLQ